MSRKTTLERFEAKFEPCPNTGCWLWNASTNFDGYGCFRHIGKMQKAHRAAYELYVGPIPEGLHVLHTCDVTWCVNPDHLFLGTPADNMRDMVSKGRGRRACGELNPRNKLTSVQALEIYRKVHAGVRGIDLASAYQITQSAVSDIKTGRRWAHLTKASP